MANPTIKTIAKAANVSPATVSKALNDMPDISESTKIRIRRICAEMGYTLNANARSLVSGSTRMIGVLVADITNYESGLMYRSIAARTLRRNYNVYLCDNQNNAEKERESVISMLENRVSAMIVQPVSAGTSPIESLVRGTVPIIYIGSEPNTSLLADIAINEAAGGELAARHLYRQGHRDCAVISCAPATPKHRARIQGFEDYMQRHGCAVRTFAFAGAQSLEKAGDEAAARLVREKKRPTALFAPEDLTAIGAMFGLRARGIRVPEDISIVGYGDMRCGALSSIGLTTLRPPSAEIGICAGDLAADLIEGKEGMLTHLVLDPTLVERATVSFPFA